MEMSQAQYINQGSPEGENKYSFKKRIHQTDYEIWSGPSNKDYVTSERLSPWQLLSHQTGHLSSPNLVLKAPKVSGGLTFSPHWESKLGPNISEGCGRASNKVNELANKREGKSGKQLKSKKQKTTKQTSQEQQKQKGPLTCRIDLPTSNNLTEKISHRTTQRPTFQLSPDSINHHTQLVVHCVASTDADLTGVKNAVVYSGQAGEGRMRKVSRFKAMEGGIIARVPSHS